MHACILLSLYYIINKNGFIYIVSVSHNHNEDAKRLEAARKAGCLMHKKISMIGVKSDKKINNNNNDSNSNNNKIKNNSNKYNDNNYNEDNSNNNGSQEFIRCKDPALIMQKQ